MGGYAAVRVGLALGADVALAFSPQVLIDSTERAEAELPSMPFDDLLRGLKRVLWIEGQRMLSLVEAAAQCREPHAHLPKKGSFGLHASCALRPSCRPHGSETHVVRPRLCHCSDRHTIGHRGACGSQRGGRRP